MNLSKMKEKKIDQKQLNKLKVLKNEVTYVHTLKTHLTHFRPLEPNCALKHFLCLFFFLFAFQ